MPSDRPRVLVTTNFDATFNRDALWGIVAYARQHTNWKLICLASLPATKRRQMLPDALLVTGMHPELTRWARKQRLPFVVIGSDTHNPRQSRVSADDQSIGTMAVEYLCSLGLRHLAYVGHGAWPFVRARRDSFVAAARSRGIASVHQLIGRMDTLRRRQRFQADLEAMLRKLPRPCGLLAMHDPLGVSVIEACRNIGLRVPHDIAVLGVDNDQLACELSEVPLSSIVQSAYALGATAARLLDERMKRPDRPPAQLSLPPLRVVARASTDLIALDDEDVVAALTLISRHIAEPINVDWVVKRVPIARRTLFRKFKLLVGRTMLEHIHHVRLQRAKELLSDFSLSVDAVAQRSGFGNARWMAESFRRQLGLTPVRFRRQLPDESRQTWRVAP